MAQRKNLRRPPTAGQLLGSQPLRAQVRRRQRRAKVELVKGETLLATSHGPRVATAGLRGKYKKR